MINLLISGNINVFDGMIIETLSIIKYCSSPIHLYLLTMTLEENKDYVGINERQREVIESILKEKNKNSKVTLIDYSSEYKKLQNKNKNKDNPYTPYATLRLYSDLIDILPDKILYLDTDVTFLDDLNKLYSIDISEYEYAASLDYYGHVFINRKYINSGVLLLNMKKIKETGLFRKCREMVDSKKMLFADQNALNKLAKNKLIISRRFNEQHKIQKDTVVRHFSKSIIFFPYFHTRNIKPWHIDKLHNVLKVHELDDILEKYKSIKEDFKNEKVQ